ncbi:DMT family transporter [Marinithermus hydrothermalis]|uniref:EamA domain-containing protein n=1 Tax=Marinithermus hydrothermalis (strain DSM 14884 / JCM 11576 / T1) TaxID=869210 RepID=F2NRA0_MARHT|nr:DMT family transporter [Marinithermus hydrothermalis]AEB12949.1 hypothetical protein Marky_2229 [Marinithermus hydrothermalis DSM 14884]
MTALALALVLASAVLHATWNLLAKQAADGVPFVWLVAAASTLIYAPVAALAYAHYRPALGGMALVFLGGAALLHVGYFLMLDKSYRSGDLLLVYPLARGTGPLLASAAAIWLFGERPSPLALTGAALIGLGALTLASTPAASPTRPGRRAVGYALLTGTLIASYTLWDKYAVSALLLPPLLYDWATNLGRTLLLSPLAYRRWDGVRRLWRTQRRAVLGVAVLSPLAYILVLTALVFAPVSYVAPAREVSILIGAVMGARLLAEQHGPRRIAAALAMFVGIAALTIG